MCKSKKVCAFTVPLKSMDRELLQVLNKFIQATVKQNVIGSEKKDPFVHLGVILLSKDALFQKSKSIAKIYVKNYILLLL